MAAKGLYQRTPLSRSRLRLTLKGKTITRMEHELQNAYKEREELAQKIEELAAAEDK